MAKASKRKGDRDKATKKNKDKKGRKKDKKGAKGKKKRAAAVDPDAMMAACAKAATPAAGHARLAPLEGTFNTKTTFAMAPDAPPMTGEGTSVHRFVLGGRYLQQVYTGSAMGQPFEGLGFTGFDNVKNRYVGTWMDSFGTGMMHSVGVGKPKDNRIDFEAEAFEPTGKRVRFDCSIRVADRDHHSYEMWTKAPGGGRFRTMLVEYSRK